MLVKINDPRIDEQFRETWLAINLVIRMILEKKIAFITDNDQWIDRHLPRDFFLSRSKDPACLTDTEYIPRADLYTILLLEPVSHLSDAGVRGVIAHELASVYNDGPKSVQDIKEAMTSGGELDPWIPEVLSECQSVKVFWDWLADMVAFEAEKTVWEWGLDVVSPKFSSPVVSRFGDRIEGGEIKAGRKLPAFVVPRKPGRGSKGFGFHFRQGAGKG